MIKTTLTDKEKRILKYIAHGNKPSEIAKYFGVAESTVRGQLRYAVLKLGVKTVEHAAIKAKRLGLLD
jgi:DNA-binding CsgD family transcriptional regulator